jgi:peptidyl-prolyl isomerase G (cyclophilin G)
VIRGFEEVVCKIAEVPVDDKDRPTVPVVVMNCGELELRTRNQVDAIEG